MPRDLHAKHKKIVSHMDTLNINGIKFFAAAGKPSHHRSAPGVQSSTHEECFESSDEMLRECNHAGFTTSEMWCDQEHSGMMDQIKDDLNTDMNCANPQDHESDAERNNGTIKDWCRTALHRTGHANVPKVMIEALMCTTVQ